jgi:hypothetical protein
VKKTFVPLFVLGAIAAGLLAMMLIWIVKF